MADERVPRILVGERSALMRRVLADPLRETGWEVLEAGDGQEALRRTREERPDVVLLARELGRPSGLEVLDALVADDRTAGIPVLFATGRVRSSDLADGLERGAYDYVRKPVDPVELVARVRNARRFRLLRGELEARNEQLERLVRTDRLTGLANRLQAEEVLARRAAGAARHGHPFAVVICDVDHFKAVNDTRGHPVGDAVLVEVAGRLRAGLRRDDTAARWGGEEFLLVLADAADAAASCERLRASIAEKAAAVAGAEAVPITASFGWAAWTAEEPVESLLRRADAALYEAKAAGRDRVVAG